MGFFGTGNDSILQQKTPMIRLTGDGLHKLQNMEASNFNNEFNLLQTIKKYEPCEPADIAKELNIPENKVRSGLFELQKRKLIQIT